MNYIVVTYLLYLVISVGLTVWVARTLHKNGRVFLVDALDCPRCHGRMRIVAAVMEATAVERILSHLCHEPRAPSLTPARAPPERDPVDRPPGDFVDPPPPEDFPAWSSRCPSGGRTLPGWPRTSRRVLVFPR